MLASLQKVIKRDHLNTRGNTFRASLWNWLRCHRWSCFVTGCFAWSWKLISALSHSISSRVFLSPLSPPLLFQKRKDLIFPSAWCLNILALSISAACFGTGGGRQTVCHCAIAENTKSAGKKGGGEAEKRREQTWGFPTQSVKACLTSFPTLYDNTPVQKTIAWNCVCLQWVGEGDSHVLFKNSPRGKGPFSKKYF